MAVIYEPKGRAREYSPLACNVYNGCDHRCSYCWVPSVTRMSRDDFEQPKLRAGRFLQNVRIESFAMRGTKERVLLSFTCDPYQTFDVEHQVTRSVIKALHRNGIPVQVLTKGGTRALRDLDLFTQVDAFATTLTLLDPIISLQWEPGAATPIDRIRTIKRFHEAGIPTWVSLEPVLDPAVALQIIEETHPFVDLYKVGTLNYHPLAKTIDWPKFAHDVLDSLKRHNKEYYIKDDLRMFLTG